MKPKVIKTDREQRAALAHLERLMDRPNPDEAELELCSLLVEKYEDEHFPIAAPDPIEAIRFRMEQGGLAMADLWDVQTSEFLPRRRRLVRASRCDGPIAGQKRSVQRLAGSMSSISFRSRRTVLPQRALRPQEYHRRTARCWPIGERRPISWTLSRHGRGLKSLAALGLSLTQVANLLRYSGIAVRPFFGKPARLDEAAHLFVVMPFARELRPVFTGPIRRAARRLRLSVERADDIFSNGAIVEDVWNAIVNSFVVVADCTGRNPNVFYELGIAHVVGKPVVLLTQDRGDVPFDIRHLRLIRYTATAAGFNRLESALHKTLTEARESVWIPEVEAKRRSS